MSKTPTSRTGGCACGAVRFETTGEPLRAGLCHCMTCRRAHASAFNPFLVFAPDQVRLSGQLASWVSSPAYDRRFCRLCGSRVVAEAHGEWEISLGSFDEPGQFAPQYENWTVRREPWLSALPVPQHEQNRQADGDSNRDDPSPP
ncbi:GFA family protein [soil metagenome]